MSQLLYKVGIFSISVLFIQQKSSNLYNEFIIKGQKKRPGTLSRPLHILYHYTNIIPQNGFFVYTFVFFFMFLYIPQSFATSDFVAMQVKANVKIFSKNIDNGSTWEYNKATVKSDTKKSQA